MRIMTLALVGGFGLATLPYAANTAPLPTMPQTALSSNIVNVAGGCGPGYHPQSWRDRWGYWHRRCVPNYGPRPPYHGGPPPHWGWGWRGY